MKQGDLTAGVAKLDKAWKKLLLHWEATRGQWSDEVSRQFEERYMQTIEPAIKAALARMQSLNNVLTSAQIECDDQPPV